MANTLCAVFDVIVVEDLSIKALAKRKKGGKFSYGKSVADLAPAALYTILDCKAQRYDRILVRADRWFPSSKTCSNPSCGAVKAKLPLSVRTYICEVCGMVADRDVNAARNLERYPVAATRDRAAQHDSALQARAGVPTVKGEGVETAPTPSKDGFGVDATEMRHLRVPVRA